MTRMGLAQQDYNNDFGWNSLCCAVDYWLGYERTYSTTLDNDYCRILCSDFGAFGSANSPSFQDKYWRFMAGMGVLSSFCCDNFSL